MRRPTAILCCCSVAALLCTPSIATGHGEGEVRYRTRILEVSPPGLPIGVRMSGDRIRFENEGDEELVLCGYATDECEAWVRIGPDGVFEDRSSQAYHANADGDEQGDVPEDAGEGKPNFVRVGDEPGYVYHDHRVHWMGGEMLPPGVDEGDPDPQRVYDGRVEFRYGDTDGFVRTRLEYVGGRSWLQRYGEYMLMGVAITTMLVVFVVDARRRRRPDRSDGDGSADQAEPKSADQAP